MNEMNITRLIQNNISMFSMSWSDFWIFVQLNSARSEYE